MKKRILIVLSILAAIFLSDRPCRADGCGRFEMALKQDSIYTPGKIHLAMELTGLIRLMDDYRFRVSVFTAGTLIRRQVVPVSDKDPTVFELEFPEVVARTGGRCRSELLIGGDFFESREIPFTLWPPIVPYPGESVRKKLIWTFDTSGVLQEIFEMLEVETVDATFQLARDFGSPDIVFIGQDIDSNSVRWLTERLMSVKYNPIVIYLKQKQFPKETKLEIPTENNRPQKVKCDANSLLLNDLTRVDIMKLVENTVFVKTGKDIDAGKTIESYITEVVENSPKNIYSYLCSLRQAQQTTIYCQLPVTDQNDPQSVILLKNLLKYADHIINSRENRIPPDNERSQL